MIKVILAEDHQIVRNGIKTILEQEDIKIAGEASNGLEVLKMLESGIEADIVLTDIGMPEMDGLMLAAKIDSSYPGVKVVILSMLDQENYIFDAFDHGIKGYLLKNTTSAEMIFALKHVAAGNEVLCSELGLKMLKSAAKKSATDMAGKKEIDVTAREQEVLTLIAEGYTNQEIADKTFTSRRTVEGHRQSLIDKTGVKNTAQLIKLACKAGWI